MEPKFASQWKHAIEDLTSKVAYVQISRIAENKPPIGQLESMGMLDHHVASKKKINTAKQFDV